jgi:hypothetical protein
MVIETKDIRYLEELLKLKPDLYDRRPYKKFYPPFFIVNINDITIFEKVYKMIVDSDFDILKTVPKNCNFLSFLCCEG